ncbi:MAG: helix-turn-helix transcriptional regulator [bacterium]|nr:helix-turn-helix transcriptional regulator [bacterium]
MTKKEAFEFLDRIAQGIAVMFGEQCETLVHEIDGQKIVNVAIYNGHVSGRTVGSTLSIYGKDTLLDEDDGSGMNLDLDYVNQMVVTSSGKSIKSSTFHFRGEDYHYALGINYDITVLGQINHVMENLLRTEETLRASLSGRRSSDMEELFESCQKVMNRPLAQMQKAERIALVGMLKEKGFFQIQKSVPYAAERLGVTKYTIYNYLNELGGI